MSLFLPATICILLCTFSGLNGLPINIINNVTNYLAYNEYEVVPSLYLLYAVDAEDFQLYIDPRFKLAKFENQSYIVMSILNMSAYYNGAGTNRLFSFDYLQSVLIYTIVEYKNTLSRTALAVAFNFTPPAVVANLYQSPPYGSYLMEPDSVVFSADNQTGDYRFSSKAITLQNSPSAEIDVTVKFDNIDQEHLNYNDQKELAGFFLSRAHNKHGVQSRYRKNGKKVFAGPVLEGSIIDLSYTQITNCVEYSVESTYIQALIGNIKGLDENNPAACFYVPYTHFFNEPALPANSGKTQQ